MDDKRLKYLIAVFRIIVLCYFVVALFYFMKKPPGLGDEALFISDLKFIKSEGWITAISKGVSIPYMLLVYPIAQFLEPYVALRGVNMLLFVSLIGYFYKFRHINLPNFYYLLLFFYSTVGYFLSGTNDTLFIVSMVVFFSETYFIITSEKKEKLTLLGIALIVAFFTRELFLVFLPVILLSLVLLKAKKLNFKSLLIPGFVFCFFLILNFPSLQENRRLSFDLKSPPEKVEANWVQRQYLAQMLVNEGKLDNYNHPSWSETDSYLVENGINSLPNSTLDGMIFNLRITLKEFLKDLLYIGMYSVRQLALILPIILFLGIREFCYKRRITEENYLPVIVLSMMLIFALIIISFVELRWLGAVFIMSILHYFILVKKNKIPILLVNMNYLTVVLLCVYGMYGLFQKLF